MDYDEPTVSIDGVQEWWVDNKLHRGGDLPAIVMPHSRQWWFNGRRHRDGDKPAVCADTVLMWYAKGRLHRGNDRPAIARADGSREWWKHGKRHRGDNKPAVVGSDGSLQWWENDQCRANKCRYQSTSKPTFMSPSGIHTFVCRTTGTATAMDRVRVTHFDESSTRFIFVTTVN